MADHKLQCVVRACACVCAHACACVCTCANARRLWHAPVTSAFALIVSRYICVSAQNPKIMQAMMEIQMGACTVLCACVWCARTREPVRVGSVSLFTLNPKP